MRRAMPRTLAALLVIATLPVAGWMLLRGGDRSATTPKRDSPASAPDSREVTPDATGAATRATGSQVLAEIRAQSQLPAAQRLVTVVVSDEEGQPVAGVRVVEDGSATAMTDDAGDAVFDLPVPRVSRFVLSHEGFVSMTVGPCDLCAGSRVAATLFRSRILTVKTVDPGGAPVSAAVVTVMPDPAVRAGFPGLETSVGETNADGLTAFPNLVPVTWMIHVHAKGFADRILRSRPETVLVQLDGAAAPLRILVRDASSQAPVPGVRLTAKEAKLGEFFRATTDQDGVARCHRPAGASVKVIVGDMVHVWPRSREVAPTEAEIVFEVQQASDVRCLVVRPDLTRVAAAALQYSDAPAPVPMQSDADGWFAVGRQGVPAAPFFRFLSEGGTTAWTRVNSPSRKELTLRMQPTVRLRGRVVHADGSPVSGAAVAATRLWYANAGLRDDPSSVREPLTGTDANGAFELSLPSAVEYYLVALHTHAGLAEEVLVRMPGTGGGPPPADASRPIVQFPGDTTDFDAGTIVIAECGSVDITLASASKEPWEAVISGAGPDAWRRPSRRVSLVAGKSVGTGSLPVGQYRVDVGPLGTFFGPTFLSTNPVICSVTAGQVASVTVSR